MLLFPLLAVAQEDAAALLDRLVAKMKDDAPLQQEFIYMVYDDEGVLVCEDRGVLILDNERYTLDMENMKIWCDGAVQWSYMKDIDEIYITDADSDEAQNLSPIYIMEKYREGYSLELCDDGIGMPIVDMTSCDADADVTRIQLFVDVDMLVLEAMSISMASQGRVHVHLGRSTKGHKFAKSVYKCPVKEFPTAEIVDMR